MDFDGDGILDVISGSYDPGDLYLFRGLGKGKYAKRQTLVDAKDVPLVHHPVELVHYLAVKDKSKTNEEKQAELHARVASFGSWPAMVDWDGDGDLDMLIGSFTGHVYLRRNEGTRKQPRFAAESIEVQADGKPLNVEHHADPVVADWDGDGLWDLVVGAGNGSVVWFRNTGTVDKPAFGPSQTLIAAKSDTIFLTQYLKAGEQPGQGARAQICVVDYDGDGKLDLLVGDYSSIARLRNDAEAPAELARILAKEKELSGPDDAKAHKDELAQLAQAKKKLIDGEPVTSSFVWLYRRK